MAVGDRIGEIASTYLTPAERAAQMGLKQTSFDVTNTGPIAKASLQWRSDFNQGSAPQGSTDFNQIAPTTAAPAPTQPVSLLSARPSGVPDSSTPSQPSPTSFADAGSRIGAGLLGNPQSATQKPASLWDGLPIGVQPIPGSPTYPAPGQQAIPTTSSAPTAAPVSQSGGQPPVASLDDGYRPVVGTSDTSNGQTSIVGKLNPDGTASFSNDKTDLRSAYGMAPVNAPKTLSLADQANIENASGSGPSFAALGSAKNMGDGVGGFSQFNQGDAKLAMDRYQKAADLRQGYKEQDALAIARQQASIDSSVNTIRDSSQPITRNDLAQAALDQQGRQSDQQAILNAQNGITSGQAQRAAATQARQAQGIEDLRSAALAPNATPDQKLAYQNAIDPTGAQALQKQLAQAQIGKTNAEAGKTRAETDTAPALAKSQIGKNEAETAKLNGEANGTGAAGQQRQLNQLEIDKRKTDAANAAQALSTQKAGAYDLAKEASALVSDIGDSKSLDSITGPIYSRLMTVSGPSQDLINKAERLQTLLTVDNLKLMSGVLTDKDITFLAQVGSGLNIGDGGIKGSTEGTKQRLSQIAGKLSTKLTEYEKANPNAGKPQASAPGAAQPATTTAQQAPATQQAQIPTVANQAQAAALPAGSTFIGPDGHTYRK